MEITYYKISEFAKELNRPINTVDNWFKRLEEKRLHYVNRVSGEKVYDDLDLRIGEYIREHRDPPYKWPFDGIFAMLPENCELRPFPPEETPSVPQVADMDAIMREIRAVAQQMAAAQVEEVRQQYAEIIKQLPKPVDPMEEKQKRVNDVITQRRVVAALEDEARHLWSTKPRNERMKSVGLFRKEEDLDSRNLFIRDYVNERLENRLKSEYGINYSATSGPHE